MEMQIKQALATGILPQILNLVTKESMGKRFIVSRLTEYFKGDIIKATEVYNFLEENRGKRIKDNIKLERN